MQQKLDRLNTVLQENIAGVRLVKAFVRADFEGERFEAANEDFTANSVRVMQFMSSMSPALTVFVNIGMVIVIWVGRAASHPRRALTVGQIVAFTNYLLTTMAPLTMMTMLSNAWASGHRLGQAHQRGAGHRARGPGRAGRAAPARSASAGKSCFENVSFHYNGDGGEAVLDGVNLAAEPGETVAILGATGSGKSTLINLIPRFYDVPAGRVLIDGIDVREIAQDSLLAQIGIVPQETILFSGTVRDNIRYGRPEPATRRSSRRRRPRRRTTSSWRCRRATTPTSRQRGANFPAGRSSASPLRGRC